MPKIKVPIKIKVDVGSAHGNLDMCTDSLEEWLEEIVTLEETISLADLEETVEDMAYEIVQDSIELGIKQYMEKLIKKNPQLKNYIEELKEDS